jgi:flagellin-like hook-associated protein FlgL
MDVVLSSGQRDVLTAISRTGNSIDRTQLSLASGKEVNSALDQPQNFFASQSLFQQARDLNKLLDGISTSVRTIQEANIGIETQLKIIDQAEALVKDGLIKLFPRTDETPDPEAIQYIIDQNPEKAYFDQTGNFYTNTTDFTDWNTAKARAEAAELEGVPEIRGHLATITSQEENDVVFGLLTATSWLGGSDNEVEGEWRWTEGPEAGEQFWQGEVAGNAVNGAYTNWAPGEPNQFFGAADPENYAHLRADGLWNDLPADRNLNYIIEWGGDLLVQNPDVNVSSEAMDYRRDFLALLGQIDSIAEDSSYRGIHLLTEDDLRTDFNYESGSKQITEGIDATATALGLTNDNFISKSEMTKILSELQDAREVLRDYSASLANDLSVISSRRDFIENTINTYEAGGNDLIFADINEKGSEMLALQTRQQIQFEALSLSVNSNILDLFS